MTNSQWRRCLTVVVMGLAMALGLSKEVTAQEEGARALTIFATRCTAGYPGHASADECDDTPMPNVTFRVGRPFTDFVMTARTDDAGMVTFDIADLPLRGTIRVIEELPPGTARVVTCCVDDAGIPAPITDAPVPDNDPPVAAADVSVGNAGDIRCDWYNVPISIDDATPATSATPASTPAT